MKAPKRSGKFFELLMPLLMLLIWSCSATQVNPVQDAALRARLESIKKAAILKPDVQIERKKYAGEFEPQLEEDQTVATRLQPLVVVHAAWARGQRCETSSRDGASDSKRV